MNNTIKPTDSIKASLAALIRVSMKSPKVVGMRTAHFLRYRSSHNLELFQLGCTENPNGCTESFLAENMPMHLFEGFNMSPEGWKKFGSNVRSFMCFLKQASIRSRFKVFGVQYGRSVQKTKSGKKPAKGATKPKAQAQGTSRRAYDTPVFDEISERLRINFGKGYDLKKWTLEMQDNGWNGKETWQHIVGDTALKATKKHKALKGITVDYAYYMGWCRENACAFVNKKKR